MTADGKDKDGKTTPTRGQGGGTRKPDPAGGGRTSQNKTPEDRPAGSAATSDTAAKARATRPGATAGRKAEAKPAGSASPEPGSPPPQSAAKADPAGPAPTTPAQKAPEPTRPAPASKATSSSKAAEPVKPSPAKAADPARPAPAPEPAEPAKTAPSAKTAEPAKPAASKPAEPAKPAASRPAEPAGPAAAAAPPRDAKAPEAREPEAARPAPPEPRRLAEEAPPKPLPPLADGDEMAAIIETRHRDPFAFLGLHRLGDTGAQVVRTFQPDAQAVSVIDAATGTPVAELQKLHDAGLFAGAITDRSGPFAYRLRLVTAGGAVDVDDAYRFPTRLTLDDLNRLAEGRDWRAYDRLGAHPVTFEGVAGVAFAVWAPNAFRVAVVGDFNQWDGRRHGMRLHPGCGVWDIFVPAASPGQCYKFEVRAEPDSHPLERRDPCAFQAEHWPGTASVVADLTRTSWRDQTWMARRQARQGLGDPISVYEVDLGSWRRVPEEGNRRLTYEELANQLADYVRDLGFTHVQILPVAEHDSEDSWGYQPTAPFAPTGRFGSPEAFRRFVDRLHQAGIGVILDWVGTQFAEAQGGLARFDGSPVYEPGDPRIERHARSNLFLYDYSRPQVVNYLIANALYWLDRFHIDGLRIGSLAPVLYLDYDRGPGEWPANEHGGNENLHAIAFLRGLNERIRADWPGVFTVAEEHSGWQAVSRPIGQGGLGFSYKANDAWLHQALGFLARRPIHRKYYHEEITHGPANLFQENHFMALSHDFVAHGRGSLIERMPGNHWDKFANLRQFYALTWTQPGKKLVFMGDEFAQWRQWNHEISLDWHLLDDRFHRGVQGLIRDLNVLYTTTPALHELDCDPDGFAWIDCNDTEQSVISWLRLGREPDDRPVAVVCNFTPVVRRDYRIGVPLGGYWEEVLNTDAERYGGSNVGNSGGVWAQDEGSHGRPHSVVLQLPPYGAVVIRHADHKPGA